MTTAILDAEPDAAEGVAAPRRPRTSPGSAVAPAAGPRRSGPNFVCSACFGPLEVVYDYDVARERLTRETIAARPPGSGGTSSCCPSTRRRRGGWPSARRRSSRRAGSAADLGIAKLHLKDDTRNPTLSFKDRVVAVAVARAVEFGFDTIACASTGNLAGATAAAAAAAGLRAFVFVPSDLEPAKIDHALALRRDRRPRRRHVRRHQPARPRDRRRGGLGLRQRQPPAVLRRGQQDARVRDRRAARLAAAGRPRRADRVGLAVHEGREGLRRAGDDRARRAQGGSLRRRPAGRLLAGRDGVRDGRRDRPGPAARHDRPLARDRLAGRRRLRDRAGAADGRLDRGGRGRDDRGDDPARRRDGGHLRRDRRRRDGRGRGPGAGGRDHPRRRRGRRAPDRQRRQDPRRAPVRRHGRGRRRDRRRPIAATYSAFAGRYGAGCGRPR